MVVVRNKAVPWSDNTNNNLRPTKPFGLSGFG